MIGHQEDGELEGQQASIISKIMFWNSWHLSSFKREGTTREKFEQDMARKEENIGSEEKWH